MLQMIILGIVQGLTEFLPVSSSAHLIFAEHFLGIRRPQLVLEAVLHLGTALAAAVLFWPDVRRLLSGFAGSLKGRRVRRSGVLPDAPAEGEPMTDPYGRVAWVIIGATLVTAAIGLVLRVPFERMFESVRGTALQLILTGVILILGRERGRRAMTDAGWPDAALIGVAQAVSIVPGISRSGITIAAGLWGGFTREEAARLSFLVSIPAITGAGLFALKDVRAATSLGYTPVQLIAGFVVSAIFGALAIRWLLDIVRRGRLAVFAGYCWVVGAAVYVSTLR